MSPIEKQEQKSSIGQKHFANRANTPSTSTKSENCFDRHIYLEAAWCRKQLHATKLYSADVKLYETRHSGKILEGTFLASEHAKCYADHQCFLISFVRKFHIAELGKFHAPQSHHQFGPAFGVAGCEPSGAANPTIRPRGQSGSNHRLLLQRSRHV